MSGGSTIRRALVYVRARYRRLRFWAWTVRVRVAMWRAGGRLIVEAPYGCTWSAPPHLKMAREGPLARGTLTLRFGRQVSFGRNVLLEVWGLGENVLEIGDGTYLLDDVHVALRHGSVRVRERSRICNYAIVKSAGEIVLGSDLTISHFCMLHCDERIEVGDHCGIGERVTMVDSEHVHDGTDTPFLFNPIRKRPIVVGRNVFVGTNATITEGSNIGDNAVIAAGSVLTGKDYPGGWVSGGVPAKPIRELAPAEVAPASA
jgi:acetyltransferase-like isoleucine patch superfamily enzyme